MGCSPQLSRHVKIITHKIYTEAVDMLDDFVKDRTVYGVESLPEKQGVYGFVVYY